MIYYFTSKIKNSKGDVQNEYTDIKNISKYNDVLSNESFPGRNVRKTVGLYFDAS